MPKRVFADLQAEASKPEERRTTRQDFYAGLAQQLRATAVKTSARAAQATGVPLAALLDGFDKPEAAAPMRALMAQVKEALTAAQEQAKGFDLIHEPALRAFPPLVAATARFYAAQIYFEVDALSMPRALVTAFASIAERTGFLSPTRVAEVFGDEGMAWLDRASDGTTATRLRLKFQDVDHVTMSKIARSRAKQSFAERMPVLEDVRNALQAQTAFAGYTLVSVQHLLPNTRALYDTLVASGLTTPDTAVGGKNYSANPEVVARMVADGFDVAPEMMPNVSHTVKDAEVAIYDMAKQQLGRLLSGVNPNTEARRFLILDEGAKIIKALHEHYPSYAHLFTAVEQTDRGIQIIEQMKTELRCPVINMARSEAKKQMESPAIGESVVHSIELELAELGLVDRPKVATIIGYGAVGKASADALRKRGYTVYAHDIDPAALERAKADGCIPASREHALANAHLLVSCVGKTVLRPEDFDKTPPGAVLANAASGNHELGLHELADGWFNAQDPHASCGDDAYLRSQFAGAEVSLGDASSGDEMVHRVVRAKDGSERLVLRSGYVINLRLGMPPEYAQLTRSLLFASCVEAVRAKDAGLAAISDDVQRFAVSRTQKRLAEQGLSITEPNFNRLAPWAL